MAQSNVTTSDNDLNWVYRHMEELAEYEGKSIAVLNHQVIAAGTTDEVVDFLDQRNINGALLFEMPDDVHRKVYLIG